MASPDTPFCFYCEEVGDDDGDSTASDTAAFRLVRTVRLLRLVKLLRILRASRIITRWQVPSRDGTGAATARHARCLGSVCLADRRVAPWPSGLFWLHLCSAHPDEAARLHILDVALVPTRPCTHCVWRLLTS